MTEEKPAKSKQTLSANRRLSERVQVKLPVKVRLPSLEAAFSSEAVNISEGGVFIAMSRPPKMGTLIALDICIGAEKSILKGLGKVVRHNFEYEPVGVGMQFVHLEHQSPDLVQRLIADERLFGNYKLEAVVGIGGMARVYRARALFGKKAGAMVAIKRILEDFAGDAQVTDLFVREGQLLEELSHPGIVKCYDWGRVGKAQYLAIEYVDGCNLAFLMERCRTGGFHLPVPMAAFIVGEVARTLGYLHAYSVGEEEAKCLLHADVAPSNIVLGRDGRVVLIDFGVASWAGGQGDAPRMIAGKPGYTAPEIIDADAPLPASDLFSLTAVFFELLTNQKAFAGEESEVIYRNIQRGEFPAPESLRDDLSDSLISFLMRGLSPDTNGRRESMIRRISRPFTKRRIIRYGSTEEFLRALEVAVELPQEEEARREVGLLVDRLCSEAGTNQQGS